MATFDQVFVIETRMETPLLDRVDWVPGFSAFAFALPPTSISYQRPAPTVVRMTLQSTVVQRSKPRRYDVSMQLDLGIAPKLGFDRDGYPRFAGGRDLADELLSWLDEYWHAAAKKPSIGGAVVQTRLVLHDTYNRRHLVVEPTSVQWQVQDGTGLQPQIGLQFVGYEDYGLADGANVGFLLTASARLRKWVGQGTRWAERAAGIASLGLSVVGESFDALALPATAIRRSLDAVESLRVQYAALAGRAEAVFESWDAVKGRYDALGRALDDVNVAVREAVAHDGVVPDSGPSEALLDLLAVTTEAAAELNIGYLASRLDPVMLARQSRAATAYAPTDEYVTVLSAAQSLDALAAEHGTTALVLRDLNDLVPPYVSESGLPGTLAPGDPVLLPVPESVGQTPDDAAVDFALGDDGDLVSEPGDEPSDVQTVAGLASLVQGLGRVRLRTSEGENPLFPLMGVPGRIGDSQSVAAGVYLSRTVAQILREDRIARVRDEVVAATGLGYSVSAAAVLRSGRRVDVEAAWP